MKVAPFVLVPLVLLSCHNPSPPGTAHPADSSTGKAGKTDTPSASAHPDTAKTLSDTPSTPMVAKNWAGIWRYQEQFSGGELKITDIGKKTFSFSMEATDGGGSGSLEGTAKLQGYHALYEHKDEFDACTIEFTFSGDSIYVSQQQGNCGAGAGVYFSGYYFKHPPAPKEKTLVSVGGLLTEAQDKKIKALVGEDYQLFVQSSQMTFQPEKDIDSLHALVYKAGVKHEFTFRENIIMINEKMDIWAAVIHDDSVYYYTNRPDYKNHIPKTIDAWREHFSEDPIIYK